MQDLLLNDIGDLNFPLQRGESTQQHQQLLLVCAKGEFKENPTSTVGLSNYLESENTSLMLSEIRRTFINDGMVVKALKIDNGKIIIDAKYNS